MLQVHGKRHGVDEHATGTRKLMHRLEHIILVQDVLRGAEISDQSVFTPMRGGHRVKIEVLDDGPEPAVDIDAAVSDAERFVEQPGRLLTSVGRVEQNWVDLVSTKCFAEGDHQVLLWAPEILRTKFHDLGDAFNCSLQLELSVELDLGWSKSHGFSPTLRTLFLCCTWFQLRGRPVSSNVKFRKEKLDGLLHNLDARAVHRASPAWLKQSY